MHLSHSPYAPGDVVLGKYRIERVLGAGNMGLVLSAVHIDLETRVAIKLMLPGKAPEEQHQRFLREARACAKLTSVHVARVLDVGTTESGAPFMVMEHLTGRDLAAELAARGPLPIREAVGYVLQACEAVAEAHAAGIVHRDIKPANLFLTEAREGAPRVKLLDFGVSKSLDSLALTGDLTALGSPLYMSPEQMESSRDVDARSDLWGLGVTLFELVAGKTPFHAERIEELCTRVYMKPPTPLATFRSDAPPGFEAVLGQCFEKDRERRWPHVAALAAALVPFGPPSAVGSAQRTAAVLGQHVELVRSTDRLPQEPGLAGTGAAVVKAAAVAGRRSRRVVVAAAVLAAVVLVAGIGVRWRVAAGEAHPAGSASAVPAAEAPSATSVPERDAAVPVVPASSSTVVPSAMVVPAAPSPRSRNKALPQSPPPALSGPVPAKPAKPFYDP